jgi:predicted DNA binding CopG/RHH family protein
MSREAIPGLVLITIRLRADDVQRARDEGKRLAIPYQHVIRSWVADAATKRAKRRTTR